MFDVKVNIYIFKNNCNTVGRILLWLDLLRKGARDSYYTYFNKYADVYAYRINQKNPINDQGTQKK